MKYLKTYEKHSDDIRCTIDIRFLTKDEIIQICNNIINILPDYIYKNSKKYNL